MTKRCRKSILCQPRRGRCCLGGAVFVVLQFRHLRIALSSAKALRGVSTNSQRLSPNQALHLSSMKAEHQTHRCCAVSFSSPQNLPSTDSCLPIDQRAPAAEGRVVASPEQRDLHSPLETAHSVLLNSLPRPISRFLRGNSGQRPTESSWSSSPVSMPTGRTSDPPVFALTRVSLSVTRATPPVSSRRASYLAASFAATVSASKELYLAPLWPPTSTAGLLSFPPPHQPSLRLLSGRTRVKDTPLLFRLLSARYSLGISTRGSKTFWHLCLQLSLFVLCLTSLWATSFLLSPLAAPSIYHTVTEMRRHACRRLPPVPPPAWLLFFLWVYFWASPT